MYKRLLLIALIFSVNSKITGREYTYKSLVEKEEIGNFVPFLFWKFLATASRTVGGLGSSSDIILG